MPLHEVACGIARFTVNLCVVIRHVVGFTVLKKADEASQMHENVKRYLENNLINALVLLLRN